VSVSHSEPTQKSNPSASDQPSSSSSHVQIIDEPSSDILDPDYLDNQLAEINEEMHTLLNLRKTPFLPLAYQDKWPSVKDRMFSLVNNVSTKWCRIQAHAMKCRMKEHLSTKHLQSKTLYLTNSPFYAESDYITRESKVFQMLK